MKTRDLAYCGLFGSLALALPTLFHAFGVAGQMLLPMYWPLMTLAVLVPARKAALVALVVPWAGAVLTGMPLLWPPLAAVLSVELALQVLVFGAFARKWRMAVVLGITLVAGRFLHAGLIWLLAREFQLPAGVLAGASLLAGWPGVAVMMVFVPLFAGAVARRDGVCEVRFLKALRRMRLPEGVVLVCAQALRWFETLGRDAEMLARALELRRAERGERGGEGPAIEIDGLVASYEGASEPALELSEFRVERGEKVALLGPNGGGKTTLLAVLAGFVNHEGRVKVLGLEPRGRSLKELRGRLGVLFENPDDQFLFPTVREDVGWALRRRGVPKNEVSRKVDELLAELGLPTGNRPIASLSRGQRQRVAMAGLLAAEPELLLLDEPTSALDAEEKERLAGVLKTFPAAMLVATHDRDFADRLCTSSLHCGIITSSKKWKVDEKMKKLVSVALSVVAAAMVFTGCEKAADDGKTKFVVGFDADFPPYGFKEGKEYKGFDLDLAREVCARKGWTFVANPINWDAKDMELNSGSISCIWNGFTMQGREEGYTWTEPYVDNSQVVMVKKGGAIKTLKDLVGKKVGVQTDTPVQKALAGKEESKKDVAALGKTFAGLVVMPNYNQAVMDLDSGAVDAVALDVGVAKKKMADMAGKFELLKEVVMTETYGIGFKKGNTQLRDEVQAVLKELVKDGTMAKIADKYGIERNALILK